MLYAKRASEVAEAMDNDPDIISKLKSATDIKNWLGELMSLMLKSQET